MRRRTGPDAAAALEAEEGHERVRHDYATVSLLIVYKDRNHRTPDRLRGKATGAA